MATPMEEQILRAAKEIVVKFIETGRVSPTTFPESFSLIYRAVADTVRDAAPPPTPVAAPPAEAPEPVAESPARQGKNPGKSPSRK